MNKLFSFLVLAALAAIVSAIPAEEDRYVPQEAYEIYSPAEIVNELHRSRRSPKPDEKDDKKWVFNPNLGRGEDGNTRGTIQVERKGDNHDIHAGWGKVVDGPDKGQKNWFIGGTINWD